MGSPPPMRGKGNRFDQPGRQSIHQLEDHPRLCGEKFWLTTLYTKMSGSPPPMRGKVTCDLSRFLHSGITPAYAGKSRKPVHCRKPVQDHPRLCGEKVIVNSVFCGTEGSPPPMRGKAQSWQAAYFACGDHPRLCGEKCSDSEFFYQNLGSPPPMRGKVHRAECRPIKLGITPAYAGKRSKVYRCISGDRDPMPTT